MQYRRRFLHSREQYRITKILSFGVESIRRIIGIGGVHELLERLDGNAISLFELGNPPVAKRDSHDRRDERLLTEAGAHPLRIMVAPRDGEVPLPAQRVDHAVDAWSAVA